MSTGTRKMKNGTKPNLNPSPISNFISSSLLLFPFFSFPFPVLIPHSPFPAIVIVACTTDRN